VLGLLARARPAGLDRDPGQGRAGLPPEEVAARLAAAHGAPGAEPAGRERQLPGGPRHRRGLLAGAGLTVTAAAAAAAVLVATAGSGAPPSAHHGPQPVLLAASTVRQVATASRSALATSGRATVTYRTTQNGAFQSGGTDNITFSGKNWNDVISSPGPRGRSGHSLTAINRIVNGQFYLYIAGRTPQLHWYHDTNPSGHPSFTIPDPRTVLRALAPSARFEVAGYQVIGGMRLKELRATDPSHVTGLGMLADVWPGGRVQSLEVWVDSHGVVHRMALTSSQTSWTYPSWAYNMRHKAGGEIIITVPNKAMAAQMRAKIYKASASGSRRMVVRVAPRNGGPRHREVAITTLAVTFSSIGQPQRIVAPRHAIQQFGQG
jgi:hypothetical protein